MTWGQAAEALAAPRRAREAALTAEREGQRREHEAYVKGREAVRAAAASEAEGGRAVARKRTAAISEVEFEGSIGGACSRKRIGLQAAASSRNRGGKGGEGGGWGIFHEKWGSRQTGGSSIFKSSSTTDDTSDSSSTSSDNKRKKGEKKMKKKKGGGAGCGGPKEQRNGQDSSDDDHQGPRFRCRKCALPIGPQHSCKAMGGPAHRIY